MPGPQARIGLVTIDGVPAEGRDAFLREVHALPSTPYEPPEITSRLADYVEKLRKRGRYLAAGSYRPRPSEDGTVVNLAIELETGPVVTVAFRGDPLPQDKLAELAPIAREGSVDQDLIEDSIQRIKSYLTQQGYWKADASAERQEGQGTLTVAFTVRRGLPYRIADGVEVVGNQTVPLEQLRPALAKLQANDVFVESNLSAAVSGIAGMYQRLGFARAKVAAAANELNPSPRGQGLVRPVITITEGPLTLVGDVTFEGQAIVPQEQLRAVVKSAPGAPFYQPQVVADYDAVLLEYRNRGFAAASVVVVPGLSEDGTRADLKFQSTRVSRRSSTTSSSSGTPAPIPRSSRASCCLQEGKPLGLEDLIESQRRLGALGLFRRIRIDPLSHASGGTTDVLVTVEEAATATFSYGGGLEVSRLLRAGEGGGAEERVEFAPRGFFDVGRRNIGGKNRSVNLYTRLSLRPKSPEPDGTERSGFGFSEYRVVGTFREPRAFGVNADLSLTAAVEQGVRSSFNFARKGVNAELVHRAGARNPDERAVYVRNDQDVRRAARPGRSGADRPHLPAGPSLRVRRRDLPRHARRRARADAGYVPQRGWVSRRPGAGGAGRLHEVVHPGPLVPARAREIARHLRLAPGGRPGRRVSACGAVDRRAGQPGHRDRGRPAGQRALLRRR